MRNETKDNQNCLKNAVLLCCIKFLIVTSLRLNFDGYFVCLYTLISEYS